MFIISVFINIYEILRTNKNLHGRQIKLNIVYSWMQLLLEFCKCQQQYVAKYRIWVTVRSF